MGVIKSICCNNNKLSSDIIQDTIRLNEQNKKSNNNKNNKESNINGEKKNDTITNPTEENKKTIPNDKNEKIYKRVSFLQNHNQRRKSISISINQINQLTNETKIKRREKKSHSTINQNLKLDLSNFKYKLKETYNQLPSNKKKIITLSLTPKNNSKKNSSSSINSDDLSPSSLNIKKDNLDIEEINEPFTEKQLSTLKSILKKEELIIDEMDEATINVIINSISFIRINKSKVIIFSYEKENESDCESENEKEKEKENNEKKEKNENKENNENKEKENNENYYYIVYKGKLSYLIDDDKYELPKYNGIGTNALIKNSKKNCSLLSMEKSYIYKLPIEKYKIIAEDFFNKEHKMKVEFLSKNFFFSGFKLEIINIIAESCLKIKYNKKTILQQEDQFNNSIYMVLEGYVTCSKGEMIVKRIFNGEIFGEIGIFNQIESLYTYTTSNDTIILKITYDDLFNILGDNAIKNIIYNIYEKSIKGNEILNQYFNIGENKSKLFNIFQFKFYFNDIIMTQKEKKILIPISGSIFKCHHKTINSKEHIGNYIYQTIIKLYSFEFNQRNSLSKHPTNVSTVSNSIRNNNTQIINNDKNKNDLLEKGELFIDSILINNNLNYSILGDECLIFECSWNDIEKNLNIPSQETKLNLYDRINLLKPLPLFKYLSPLKIFQLSNYLHLNSYKKGEIILKDGPTSDKFYIIKSGTVEIKIDKNTLKILEKNQTFGDIYSQIGSYTRKANFISSSLNVECYYIEKENYDDIVDKDEIFLKPLKKMLQMKDITMSLDNLYYLKDLGCGAYGKVYLVHDKKRFFAMKTAEIQTMNQMKEMAELYINEKNIMFSIEHPFIVSIINTFKTREYLFFLMEYVDGITLRKYLNIPERKNKDLNETQFYGALLSCVLSYLQKKKIIHRDLKPDNLMLEYTGYIKVIDFGIAKDITIKDYTNTFIGTTHYMAPEIILGKNYNSSVDYWSLGIILYEMFYGNLPFGNDEKDIHIVYNEIIDKKPYFITDSNFTFFNDFISGLLNKNPKKRINSFNKVKSEKFFEKFDFDGLLNMKIKGYYRFDKVLNQNDLNYIDVPFINYMKNNLFTSSGDLDDFLLKNEEQVFNDF